MVRLAVVVEGATEVDFVDRVLTGHLSGTGIYPIPASLQGRVSVQRLSERMSELYWNHDVVTSLVDYYGFEDKGQDTVAQLEGRIHAACLSATNRTIEESAIIPYVQRHEFEGLLFSEVSAFAALPQVSEDIIQELAGIRRAFPTPEDINDGPNSAPSKRIEQLLFRYNKRVNGPQIAQAIGLSTIRAQCPRFNYWVARLESLAA